MAVFGVHWLKYWQLYQLDIDISVRKGRGHRRENAVYPLLAVIIDRPLLHLCKEVPGPFVANTRRPLGAEELVRSQGQQHITRQHGKERARVQYDGKSIIGHHLKIVPADVLTSLDELVQRSAALDLHGLLVGQNVLH
jgi:hypothetical protein